MPDGDVAQRIGPNLEREDKVRVWTYLLARLQRSYLGTALPWPGPLLRWAAGMILDDLGYDPGVADDVTVVEATFESLSRGTIAGASPTGLELLLRAMMSNWSASELLREGAPPKWGELYLNHPVLSLRCDAVMVGPAEWWARFAHDPSPVVRRLVASRRPIPPEVAVVLAGDPDAAVRRGVAGDPSCSADVLAVLAADPVGDVAAEVAANPAIPHDIASRFSTSSVPYVRARLAENPGCPIDVLDRLRGDRVPQVARTAAFTLRKIIERR